MSSHLNKVKTLSVDNDSFNQLTLGQVIDTNDPQQMGRIRVMCPFFGDSNDTTVKDLPWATPISPLAGTSTSIRRGRNDDITVGPVAYGMFNVPKVGSFALIACIEGDPKLRVYLGGMHDQFLPHTMPHGRYTYTKNNELLDEPSGPLSSAEKPIQPLYDSQTKSFKRTSSPTNQFTPDPRKSFEYRTRGADIGVAGVHRTYINSKEVLYTELMDGVSTEFTEQDGNVLKHTHGYDESRIQKNLKSKLTGELYDSQVYGWTTPGFHAISMSDSADSCRIRLRSTHGHQVIMDDTNERIYISTAGGKTWIEMDENGNIDIYGERNISIHAEKDINFTAGDTFRVKAKNGIHMVSEGEMRLHAKGTNGDLHIKSDTKLRMHSIGGIRVESEDDIDFSSASSIFATAVDGIDVRVNAGTLFIETTDDIDMKAGKIVKLEAAGGILNLKASGDMLATAAAIHLNGPAASSATGAIEASESGIKESFWPDRLPEHEPWARTMTLASKTDQDVGNTHVAASEHNYSSPDVGRIERGEPIPRNTKWHR